MSKPYFGTPEHYVTYHFNQPKNGVGKWEVCAFAHKEDAQRYPDLQSILFDLAGDRWAEIYNVVTDTDFHHLGKRNFEVQSMMLDLTVKFRKRTF